MLLDELRERTRACHEKLERGIDLDRRIANLDSYRQFLERWYGWYLPWEQMAASQPYPEIVEFMRPRWKTPMLQSDLEVLSSGKLERLPEAGVFVPKSEAEWIGAIYVLEGSTLGGQIISRRIEERLPLSHGRGYSFFRSYGERVGSMWNEFRQFAHKTVSSDKSETTVAAADRTFSALHRWLCLT